MSTHDPSHPSDEAHGQASPITSQPQARSATADNPDDSGSESSPEDPGGREKLVPASESIRYRRRAQAAEQEARQLREALDKANASLRDTTDALESVERRQRVDALLIESDVIDLEAARLLTEAAIATMDEADLGEVVDDLRQRKPYLFKRNETGRAMSARPRHPGPGTDDAAELAARTGDRADLLEYLRKRRRRDSAS